MSTVHKYWEPVENVAKTYQEQEIVIGSYCNLPLQLVNLHRNRRYFVIKLHTWFCLSYFLKTNITLYCIYQYFMSINSLFNTVSVSRYSRPITVTCDPP